MSSIISAIKDYLPVAAFVLLPNIGGTVSSFLSNSKETWEWYDKLKKPSFNPPKWIFGPVWTGLYLSMGSAAYLVFREGGFAAQSVPLALFGSQLLLNWAWSPIFFRFRRMDLALVEMLFLWGNIAATIYAFYPVNRTAAYLLVPYLGWVSFATFLTLTYCRLNLCGAGASQQAIKQKD